MKSTMVILRSGLTLGLALGGWSQLSAAEVAKPLVQAALVAQPATAGEAKSALLSNAANFRDAGGHRTENGQWVKTGILYRSDQLDRLSDDDLGRMLALNVGTIVDLRTQSERSHEPDRVPAGVTHMVLDVAKDAEGSIGGDMRSAMAKIAAGEGAKMLIEANRDFVNVASARHSYAELIKKVAYGDDALVYHCTAGKDRTGWASAVILSLLGVSRAEIVKDYMASNQYLAEKNKRTLAMVKAANPTFVAQHLEDVMTVRPEFIEAAFHEVGVQFGSMENYAQNALGLDAATIQQLKNRLLSDQQV
ncbi:tyrosine-protein phosphatase [Sphingopyxis yananensis]|uniref:tyrosine-protein phosphatase n=1 Tax=Sphingopyxis yananensis TaxID=2886687 RepID=UPI001D11C9BC|nr:tyrosine-protein phosphatase [Sphingopyxis yananensis]MCC2601058.1 tyrosine-protein phosphatase [Sphingopyxis yananensis]